MHSSKTKCFCVVYHVTAKFSVVVGVDKVIKRIQAKVIVVLFPVRGCFRGKFCLSKHLPACAILHCTLNVEKTNTPKIKLPGNFVEEFFGPYRLFYTCFIVVDVFCNLNVVSILK